MSTKIFDAFKLSLPLVDALAFLKGASAELRPAIIARLRQAEGQHLLATGAQLIFRPETPLETIIRRYKLTENEQNSLGTHVFISKPHSWARLYVKALATAGSRADTWLDVPSDCRTELKATVFPSNGYTIGMVVGPTELTNAFLKLPGVENYEYWDHTDPPDNIPYEAWQRRGEEWDSVLPSSIPAKDGFCFQLYSHASDIIPGITPEQFSAFYLENHEAKSEQLALEFLEEEITSQRPGQPTMTGFFNSCAMAKRERDSLSERWLNTVGRFKLPPDAETFLSQAASIAAKQLGTAP